MRYIFFFFLTLSALAGVIRVAATESTLPPLATEPPERATLAAEHEPTAPNSPSKYTVDTAAAPVPTPNSGPGPDTYVWQQLSDVTAREGAIWERLRANPDNPDEAGRANAEFRDVLTAYENIIRQSPDFAEAYASYGFLLDRTGNREDSTTAFMRANKLNPNIPLVKNQLGNFLAEDGSYRAALGYYLSAIELDETEPLYHYQLGSLLHAYRDFFIDDAMFDRRTLDQKMLAAFRRAAELAPENWPYIYRYAESFYDLDTPDWEQTLEEWRKLVERADPGLPQQTCRLHEANILINLGRREDASALLASVDEPALAEEKQTLVDQLAETPEE